MVKSLKTIKQPVAAELDIFEKRFRESLRSKVPLLDKITYYIVKRKGKQIRPIFVFLVAKLCGRINDTSYTAAAFIEILHTATLVHDDVMDDSFERRGMFTINTLWQNKIAVIVGDYFLAQGLLLAIKEKQYQLLEIISDAIREMSEGELLQLEKARRLDIDEKVYYDIIRQKTASLIASTCAAGAASVTEDAETVEKMRLFGEKIGIAFQIKDDLFDYGTDDVGKPLGIDIKEKKMTLPLIYALNHADASSRRRIINNVKRHNENPEKVREIIDFVRASGGLEYAEKIMYQYRDAAFDILYTFPKNDIRDALENLVNFVTERKK